MKNIKQWVLKCSFSLSHFYSNGFRSIVSNFNRLSTPFAVEREIQICQKWSQSYNLWHLCNLCEVLGICGHTTRNTIPTVSTNVTFLSPESIVNILIVTART